jgi:hypothetical protein
MKKINLILSFILLNTIVFPAYAVDDGDTKLIIQQDVGIKIKNPSATFHLNGTGLFEDGTVSFSNTSPVTFNSLALVNSNLQIPTGAAPGFVLISNATGVASWADPLTVTSAGDNLGNHVATQNLNMATRNITSANIISANVFNGGVFRGNGSGLTGVSASNGTINNTIIRNSSFNGGTVNNSVVNNSTINNSIVNNGFLQDPTINGLAAFTTNSIAEFKGQVKITTNAGAGKILISDKNGKAMWTYPGMVQTNGDNMGNHTANRNLDMASHDITSVKNITATSFNGGTFNGTFQGDGSGLTNVKSSVFKILANTILNNGSQASYANNFLIGSPSMDDSGNSSHDAKFFFNKAKAAFRAGTAEGNEWNDINVGQNSIAFGKNTRASGENSLAVGNGSSAIAISSISLGYNTTAAGPYSVALGYNTIANQNFSTAFGNSSEARGRNSTAFGYFSKATGEGATAFGKQNLASGIDSIAFGQEAQATNVNAIAIGKNVRSTGNQAFTIGSGNSNLDMLTNSINNSLAIGFATNQPTLFVGPAAGGSTDGKIGIGTNTPQDLLDVDGRLRTREFRMPTGAANNFILTSDGIGVGTWKSLAAIGGDGDDLGNHTATTHLDMATRNIINAGTIIAASFGGSGGGITDINAANISTGVLHIDRIPNIPASKLASLSLDDLTDAITNSARNNVFVGENSGNATTTTQRSTALGKDALKTITTGTNNTAVGYLSMHGLTTGFGNTAIGTRAGAGLMAAAEGNTNIGARTMSSFNSAFGLGNPQANGKYNTNIGELAGGGLYDGDNNVNIGAGAGKYMSNASNNVAIGYGAMANTDQAGAQNNIAIGYEAGQNMAGGRENIVIGSFADVQTGYNVYSGRNNIILGNGIKNSFDTNNSVNIGNLILGGMPTSIAAKDGSIIISGSLEATKIKLTTGTGAGKVLTSDAAGNATWQTAPSGADNLGNHSALRDLNMADNDILSAGNITSKDINSKQIKATGLFVKNDVASAAGTRVYAEIPITEGYADFVTTTRGSGGVLAEKWAIGSLGDTRPVTNGGPNAFYIFQHKNKLNAAVNRYRYHVTDGGFTGIDTQVDAKATLDVGGGTPDKIDGKDDLLVKDDAEIDGSIFAGEVNTGCIVLGDGTRICSKQDIIDIISSAGSSNNTGCSADGYYNIPETSVSDGGTNQGYGSGTSTGDFSQCDKIYYRDTGHSLTRTWSFISPPRTGPVVFRAVRDRNGQSVGPGTWYWFNNANITITNARQAIHDGRLYGVKEFRCQYNKPTNHFTCTYHAL